MPIIGVLLSTDCSADIDRVIQLTNGKGPLAANAIWTRGVNFVTRGLYKEGLEDVRTAEKMKHPMAPLLLRSIDPSNSLSDEALINELKKGVTSESNK